MFTHYTILVLWNIFVFGAEFGNKQIQHMEENLRFTGLRLTIVAVAFLRYKEQEDPFVGV